MIGAEVRIVIVSFNWMRWAPQVCKALQEQGLSEKTIVIDNGSTDETESWVKENHPEIYFYQAPHNLGFGQGNNLGIHFALEQGADFVFLLNQDAWPEKGCIEHMIEVQQKHPEFGVLSPIQLDASGHELDWGFSVLLSYKENPKMFSDLILGRNAVEPVYELSKTYAASWLMSKECLQKVGGFDPIFFMYGEDNNYCQRVIYHGFKNGIVSKSFLRHDRKDRYTDKQRNAHKIGSELTKLQRKWLVQFADINNPNAVSDLKNLKQKFSKSARKGLFKLSLNQYKHFKERSKILEDLLPEIEKSRKINQEAGPHYLSDWDFL